MADQDAFFDILDRTTALIDEARKTRQPALLMRQMVERVMTAIIGTPHAARELRQATDLCLSLEREHADEPRGDGN
jgi:hypothetical protein